MALRIRWTSDLCVIAFKSTYPRRIGCGFSSCTSVQIGLQQDVADNRQRWTVEKQREFLDGYMKRTNMTSLSAWYPVKKSEFIENGGAYLLKLHHGSLSSVITSIYSSHKWEPWKFNKVPPGFWKDANNVRSYLNWLAAQSSLPAGNLDHWYKITTDMLKNNCGAGLLTHYGGSLAAVLASAFPSHKWKVWHLQSVSTEQWKRDPSLQRAFLDECFETLHLRSLDDWYSVPRDEIIKLGGGSLLNRVYNGSVALAVAALYPEHSWEMWRFRKAPQGFWNELDNQRLWFESARKTLGIQTLDGWYGITRDDIVRLGGGSIIAGQYEGNLKKALACIYPNHKFEEWRFNTRQTQNIGATAGE